MLNLNSYLSEIFGEPETPVLFLDFDGTISKRDVIDRILEEFADERWLETEARWLRGEIGSRVCLNEQFSLVRAAPEELNEFLDALELDEGFLPLLDVCRAANLSVHVVSDGFDYYIRRMLEKADAPRHLPHLKIWANRLTADKRNLWRAEFPYFETVCEDGCATCKPRVMREQNRAGAPTIFVGDGLSDRFAAREATIVFAKNKLSEFCLENRLPHFAYSNLSQVAEHLRATVETLAPHLHDGRQRELKAIWV